MDKVIVVGAGPAGLATAAQLRRAHVPAIVLEQADAIASAWRGRYDRLKLNSPRWYSRLPDGPAFKAATFPSRDELVAYLDEYARRHALDVRLGVRVERIEREDDRWRLVTSAGEMQARDVVVAGGYEHRPYVPAWAGRARFRGEVLHAAGYRSPAPFAGQDVLVVGPGCSGAEIAFDLAEGGGAARPARRPHAAEHHRPRPGRRAAGDVLPQAAAADRRRRDALRARQEGRRPERVRPAGARGGRLQPPQAPARRADDRRRRGAAGDPRAPDRDRRRRRGLRRDRRAARGRRSGSSRTR